MGKMHQSTPCYWLVSGLVLLINQLLVTVGAIKLHNSILKNRYTILSRTLTNSSTVSLWETSCDRTAKVGFERDDINNNNYNNYNNNNNNKESNLHQNAYLCTNCDINVHSNHEQYAYQMCTNYNKTKKAC